jgi:hypothetical protein
VPPQTSTVGGHPFTAYLLCPGAAMRVPGRWMVGGCAPVPPTVPEVLRDCVAQGFLLGCHATERKTISHHGGSRLVTCGRVHCDILLRRCLYAVWRS